MLLPIRFKTDWALVAQRKQDKIYKSNQRKNANRKSHTYKVGDKVLLEKPGKIQKMTAPRTGPYSITKVSTNGTVVIRKGVVHQRVNIWRLTPYFE